MRLIFLHIPRTGGTSFIRSLEEVYGPEFCFLTPYDGSFAKCSENTRGYKAFAGHIMTGDKIYSRIKDYVNITILRNPIERVLSTYQHLLARPDHPFHKEALNTTLEEAVVKSHENWGLRNSMTWYLSGIAKGFIHDSDRLDAAKEALMKMALFGFTERYSYFIKECNVKLNVPVTEKQVNMSGGKLQHSQEAIRLIEEHNLLDLNLYEFARAIKK